MCATVGSLKGSFIPPLLNSYQVESFRVKLLFQKVHALHALFSFRASAEFVAKRLRIVRAYIDADLSLLA